jgi:hypothetical protein
MSERRSTRSEILGAISAGLIVVAFALLLLWHDPLVFWNDDYELSILPVFADVARSWSEGHLPLLSPYSWVCGNLAGEFQYGTFSIFVNAAVVLIWKFSLTFPQQAAALSITHLFVLAAGAFLLAHDRMRLHHITEPPSPPAFAALRRGRQSSPSERGGRRSRMVRELGSSSVSLSIFVALVAALNGWIICWGAIDWFGALAAFAWLPWAWWGAERALDAQRSHWRFLWPAPFVYLLITGGFPYTVLMLALLVAWLSIKFATANPSVGGSLGQTKRLMSIFPMLFGVALGVGLSAPAWLALFDYVHGSARGIQTSSAHFQWLVPPAALPALILPSWTVNWVDFSTRYLPHTGTELACGIVAPVALLAGFLGGGRSFVRQVKWELFLLVLVLLLSMLPTAGVFRWSFRWLPLVHLLLAVCAAEALRLEPRSATAATTALLLVGVSTITMSILRTTGEYAFPLAWILLALAGVWVVIEFFVHNEVMCAWIPAGVTFAALLATYFCIPPNCGVPKYNLSQRLLQSTPLDPQRLYLSVYPPAEHTYRTTKKPGPVGQVVRPGSTSMWGKLRFVNGYSPILAAGVAREFKFAIHGEIDPDVGDDLLRDQSGALEQLGIDGLVVAREIATDPSSADWQLVSSNEEGRVFHRQGPPLAQVRSITWIDSRPNEEFVTAAVSRISDSRNRVELEVNVPGGGAPALLEFSRPYFRGYEARLGDAKLIVDSYHGLIPLVELPAGSHGQLVLSYRPVWLIYGGGLSILCVIIFAAGVVAAAVIGGRLKNNSRLPPETAAATTL